MHLKDNFYTIDDITQTVENAFDITVRLEKEHPIYKGHFPEQPVVPGVCTLTIIKECLSEVLGREVSFAAIKEVKYLTALLPDDALPIVIHAAITESKVNVVIDTIDGSMTVLKLRAEIK